MLDRILRQQLLRRARPLIEAPRQGIRYNAVEQERAIDKQRKADDLEPLERLPSQPERYYPDE
jgi:hypothetical protein